MYVDLEGGMGLGEWGVVGGVQMGTQSAVKVLPKRPSFMATFRIHCNFGPKLLLNVLLNQKTVLLCGQM